MIYKNDPAELPVVDAPSYWDISEKDYRKVQNLIRGLMPRITAGDEEDITAAGLNSQPECGVLTDGKVPKKINYDERNWFKFARGLSRDVIFDLQHTSTVTGFRVVLMHKAEGGVYYPSDFTVSLSEDGKSWEKVFVKKQFLARDPDEILDYKKEFGEKLAARFVRFSFELDVWVFIGQLEVYGTKVLQRAARTLKPTRPRRKKEHIVGKYLMPADFMDIRELLLAYNCHPGRKDQGRWTVEQFLPYVGYYDREGKLRDYFFDAFLFLPFAAFPMRVPECNADLWRMYVDNTFATGYNTDALDFAFGETKRRLGDTSGRRAKVFLSILYPFKIQTQFGDLCGDGDFLSMAKLKDRKKAIKWLIDTQLALFKSRNYQYSELCGFYWFEESILISDRDEKEMLSWTTDYVRSLGYKTIWIPYYRASGYNKWWEYGIDFACMQPNHSFREGGDALLYSTAEITKKYGMCVEMEIGGTNAEYVRRYNDYLRVGAETGFMDSVHMYYQGGGPGEFYEAFKSADKALNDVYHNTYLFTKNRYEPEAK